MADLVVVLPAVPVMPIMKGFLIRKIRLDAQIASPEGGYLDGEFVHSFMGFFPADDPQFLLLVKLDKPKAKEFSASTASPTFGKMATYILNYFQVPQGKEVE